MRTEASKILTHFSYCYGSVPEWRSDAIPNRAFLKREHYRFESCRNHFFFAIPTSFIIFTPIASQRCALGPHIIPQLRHFAITITDLSGWHLNL